MVHLPEVLTSDDDSARLKFIHKGEHRENI